MELRSITSTPENVYINILMIAAFKEDGDSSMADKILSNVSSLVRSILEHTQGTALHLIILTNPHSMDTIRSNNNHQSFHSKERQIKIHFSTGV